MQCSSKRTFVELTSLTEDEKNALNSGSRTQQLLDELDSLVGFRKVIDAISKAKVPVIGHNALMDLCFIYHNFHRKLPELVEEFKDSVHTLFPYFYDTKYIAKDCVPLQDHVKNTVLTDVYEALIKAEFRTNPYIGIQD